ncbi:Rho guanine nucleotide exchange factor CDC24 [Sphaceloma murrayae]|uniref:Rho guanine nucleotide exchange factor CDC24 n=1 Tax=Sphaceloma murrayae TaxID=2082308 RepID=A0A2K1QH83_9PEZI|nr:Rho guanine nucleotide exchange factor CDC24 [Sphaceloma murrayae]
MANIAISTSETKHRLRRSIGWATCVLALSCVTALGATLVVLASSEQIPQSTRTLLIVAAVSDMLALFTFAGIAALLLRQLHGRAVLSITRRWMVCAMFWLLSLLAIILTFAASGATRSSTSRDVPQSQRVQLQTLSATAISLCVLFLVFQLVFFMMTFIPPKPAQGMFTATGTDGSFASELKDSPQSRKSRDLFSPVEPFPISPIMSSFSSTPPRRASIRDSVTNFLQPVIQPMTSKSRLIRQGSFATSISHHSRDDSWGNRAEENFDNWEVSPVEQPPQTPTSPPAVYLGTPLDPIPASRPNSPAKPLDGPFICNDPTASVTTLPSPILEDDSTASFPFARERKNSLPPHGAVGAIGRKITPPGLASSLHSATHSRQASSDRQPSNPRRPSTSDEAHIHPLFRTESPLPPPAASPGTIVTASPWGGHVVHLPDPAFFARQGSVSSLNGRESPSWPRPGSAQGQAHPYAPLMTRSVSSQAMTRSGSAQGFARPGSSQGRLRSASTTARPVLRSVRSAETWGARRDEGPVNASMPPRIWPGMVPTDTAL